MLNLACITSEISSIYSIGWAKHILPINERTTVSIFWIYIMPIFLSYIEILLNTILYIRNNFVIKEKIRMLNTKDGKLNKKELKLIKRKKNNCLILVAIIHMVIFVATYSYLVIKYFQT